MPLHLKVAVSGGGNTMAPYTAMRTESHPKTIRVMATASSKSSVYAMIVWVSFGFIFGVSSAFS